jgi:pyruvate dehydrogenase E2 component (dihydrolipoamide acetyltransferase)
MSESYKSIALSPVRKVIAARMTEAVRTIPHFRVSADIEVDALLALRGELLEDEHHPRVSVNDLLVKACATALMDVPSVNAQWSETEVREYLTADISIVTAVNGGLTTPIVRNADKKSVWDISRESRQLIARATKNQLKLDEVFGGSFSISNLGMYGVDQFDAIINQPQCAILAVGAAKPRAVASGKVGLRVATLMGVTLSVDHRAIDGVGAARFLEALRERVENPRHLAQDRE